ncbi:hypothetical protein DWF00_07385 [Bosea caraganae]|uniref:Uncharacterized protein n=1 Tax=Bosea caraganae TaxID=2763117 RepID=A0A370L0U4_9HYPH|nr:hypothetical protein [Bosea caraganae]RDJ21037.1 hypothetical protein DWE98_22180 [Bosea caraganae]RDJ28536.1 hypothetical protein DWF00_07385 [Bosea caraganae]
MVTNSDMLFQATDSADVDQPLLGANQPAVGIDTRLRLGYPRLTEQGTTETDAQIARSAAAGIPAENLPTYTNDVTTAPALTDALADVKRALMFTPHTGASFITGGRFSGYLKSNFDVRVLDGAALFQVVDQTFEADPDNAGKFKPGLNYLRVGKPEPKLTGQDGKPLERGSDLLMDQKYEPGIGLYSDGELNVWTKRDINLYTNKSFNVIADEKAIEIVGENYEVTYEYPSEDDEKRVKEGKAKPGEVDRKIVAVEMKRKGVTGWYKQEFKRGMSLDFSAANKGDVSFNSSYGVSVGAKIDHSIGLAYETSISGKIELSKSWGIEIGGEGAVSKGTAGRWTQNDQNTISANEKITLKVRDLGSLPFQTAATAYKVAAYAATAAQMGAFLAYNATLLVTSAQKLGPAGADEAEPDNAHGLRTDLDAGIYMYESCALLSAVTAAAGAVLAAVQARNLQVPVEDPLAPRIDITSTGMVLRCGANGIHITNAGVRIVANTGTVEIGGTAVKNIGAQIQHVPVPPIMPLPRIGS